MKYLLLIHQGTALDDWDGLTADEQGTSPPRTGRSAPPPA